jgi:hypothetical protein
MFSQLRIRWLRHPGSAAHATVKTTHASMAAGQIVEACNQPAVVAWSLTAIRVAFKSRRHTGAQRKAGKFTFGVAPQRRPALHVLMADRRITEVKNATVARSIRVCGRFRHADSMGTAGGRIGSPLASTYGSPWPIISNPLSVGLFTWALGDYVCRTETLKRPDVLASEPHGSSSQ